GGESDIERLPCVLPLLVANTLFFVGLMVGLTPKFITRPDQRPNLHTGSLGLPGIETERLCGSREKYVNTGHPLRDGVSEQKFGGYIAQDSRGERQTHGAQDAIIQRGHPRLLEQRSQPRSFHPRVQQKEQTALLLPVSSEDHRLALLDIELRSHNDQGGTVRRHGIQRTEGQRRDAHVLPFDVVFKDGERRHFAYRGFSMT